MVHIIKIVSDGARHLTQAVRMLAARDVPEVYA